VLRDLDIEKPSDPARPAFLSAASGLVCSGTEFYVAPDDELCLGRFPIAGKAPGTLLRLIEGQLPTGLEKRKKKKPDLEILLRLSPFGEISHGALLALGSGSRKQRRRGALLPLDAQGGIDGSVRLIDASPLYIRLDAQFDDLNLEGGWAWGDSLCLLQRGNKGGSPNAVLEFDLEAIQASLFHDALLPSLAPRNVTVHDLGHLDDVPLCFTDASVLPDGQWIFSAVAEDTDDARLDGAFTGAAIGLAAADHQITWQRRVSPDFKIEGIDARFQQGKLAMLCVSDADDPSAPARLLSVSD
jgi:hypothetical protein